MLDYPLSLVLLFADTFFSFYSTFNLFPLANQHLFLNCVRLAGMLNLISSNGGRQYTFWLVAAHIFFIKRISLTTFTERTQRRYILIYFISHLECLYLSTEIKIYYSRNKRAYASNSLPVLTGLFLNGNDKPQRVCVFIFLEMTV